MIADDAPLTSRSPERQMHERPANFSTAGEANERAMQDLSDPASSGNGAAPPSKPRPFYFVLQDALARLPVYGMPPAERAILGAIASHAGRDGTNAYPSMQRISKLTGYGVSTIVRAVEELIAHHWLRRSLRRDPETGAATSNLYAIALDGRAWGEDQKAKRTRRPPTKRRNQHGDSLQSADTPSPPLGVTPLQTADTPSPPGGHPLSAARQQTSHEPPSNLPREPPSNPPIALPRVGSDGSGQALLFRPLDAPGDPPPAVEELPPPLKPRRKPAKAEASPKEPTAAERYAAAYVAGFEAEGHTITPPTKSEAELIGRVCATHARYVDGSPITGEALEKWIRRQARRFVSTVDGSRHAGGYGAFGFRRFCDDSPPDRPRPPGETPAPPPPEPRPVYTPEQQAQLERFRRMARGERAPAEVSDG
jgi:hypothetical protein